MGKNKQTFSYHGLPFIGLMMLLRTTSPSFTRERSDYTSANRITTKDRFYYSLRLRAMLSVEPSLNS